MYLLITILAILFSANILKKCAGTISIYKLNMMSWIFYWDFLLMSVIGAVLVVYNIDHHYLIDKLVFENSRVKGFWAIIYTIVMFPIGMKLSCMLFKAKNLDLLFQKYTTKPLERERKFSDYYVRQLLIALSLVCVLSVIYVLYIIGEIPLFRFFSSSNIFNFAEFRVDVSRNFQGNGYIRNIFAYGLTPLLSYIAYGYKLRDRTTFSKWWFYIMFVCSILILTYNFAKAPVLFYGLGFLFYRIYLNGRISKKILLGTLLVILAILIAMYAILMVDGEWNLRMLFNNFNSGISGRLLLSQIAGTFLSFDIFPEMHSHLGFSSISKALSDLFGVSYSEPSARLIMEQVNPAAVKAGVAGVINSLFIGEAWANFGLAGVLIAPMYVGLLIQSLYLFFLKSGKTPFFMGLFVYYTIQSSITGGINAYLYNPSFFISIILVVLVYSLASIMKYSSKIHYYAKNDLPYSAKD